MWDKGKNVGCGKRNMRVRGVREMRVLWDVGCTGLGYQGVGCEGVCMQFKQ